MADAAARDLSMGQAPDLSCSSIAVTELPVYDNCPMGIVRPALGACQEGPLGSYFAFRDQDCFRESLMATCPAFLANPAASIDFRRFEAVEICDPTAGCSRPLALRSATLCEDSLRVEFTVTIPCRECAAVHPTCRWFLAPNTPVPIAGNPTLVMETCP